MKLSRNSKRYKQLAKNLEKARKARRMNGSRVASRARVSSLEGRIAEAVMAVVRDAVVAGIKEAVR